MLYAVNTEICRLLIRGEKGTGKSIAVRSLDVPHLKGENPFKKGFFPLSPLS